MKKTISLFFLLITSSFFSQKKLTTSQAINIMSKQAMLVERMAKDKISTFCKVETLRATKEKNSSLILFEKNINTLYKIELNPQTKSKIDLLELLWIGYKSNIKNKDKASLNKTLTFNKVVLKQCTKIYNSLIVSANQKKTYPYNFKNPKLTSAVIENNDLKYLSQRLSLYYTTYYYKLKPYNSKQFTDIINNIDNRVSKTISLKRYNLEITKKTKDLEYQWSLIKDSLSNTIKDKSINTAKSPKPSTIFRACNKILSSSDKLSRAYKATNETD